ncbi:hypothetical protein [Thauera humireducens]|uniref:hypothetical protein n=1 Tax=Thauera humireducens TaxID=1134435 RepID=UPI00311D6CD3
MLTLGAGSPDETLSAAAWRTEQDGKALGHIFRPAIDWLFAALFDDLDHCRKSYESERMRSQLPGNYRADAPASRD